MIGSWSRRVVQQSQAPWEAGTNSSVEGEWMTGSSPRGTYLVIAEALRAQLSAEDATGAVPSEADLMSTYGVARTTVRRALKSLQADGLIEPAAGVGWMLVVSDADRRPLVERIVDLIRSKKMKVGETFPSESELCGIFGVSRGAARHALAQLEGKGVLESTAGKRRSLTAQRRPQEADQVPCLSEVAGRGLDHQWAGGSTHKGEHPERSRPEPTYGSARNLL